MNRILLIPKMVLALTLLLCRPLAVQPSEPPGNPAVAEAQTEEASEAAQPGGGLSRELKARHRLIVPLILPEEVDEEAPQGLTLDAALQRLLATDRDLAIKYQDIPKARADILSASLIENPSVFLDGDGIPYGHYSPRRPGETEYEVTLVQPLDVSGKRRARMDEARRAEKVLEALYQDAVRQELDKLYSAYVDVLEARLDVRALERAVAHLYDIAQATQEAAKRRARSVSEVTQARMQLAGAEVTLRDAQTALREAQRELGRLLALPTGQADGIALRGSLHDRSTPPPATDELIQLALHSRPDLAAYRLSVDRARADVRLSKAERVDDVLFFYTPYQATTFPGQGQQTANGWETGGLAALPVFDRNQGDIARGRVNVAQLQTQEQGLCAEIVYEVRRAATEYAVSKQMVQRYENEILPLARKLHEEKYRLFLRGQQDLGSLIESEHHYDEIARRYLEALVRHRRNMLRLNTVVGQRILP